MTGVRRRDLALALLLLAGTALYLSAFPNTLGPPDEGHQLHEAKRWLDGDAFYRDIFQIILPGWMYLMAVLFHVFGTTLATARVAAAVIQGGIVAATFLACRRLGVRAPLAAVAGLACLAICQPAYPVASQHWLATFASTLLLVLCLDLAAGARRSLAAGVVLGVLVAVHHQRALAMGAAVVAFLIADTALARWYRSPRATALRAHLLALGAGTLLVVAPVLAVVTAAAGFGPVWFCLIEFPLESYRFPAPWGFLHPNLAATIPSYPRLLALLPVVLAFSVPAALALAWRRADRARARDLVLLVAFCLGSIFAVWYSPDFFHLAFIAPIFFVAVADAAERTLRALPERVALAAGGVLALGLSAALSFKLATHLVTVRSYRPIALASAFGRIDIGRRRAALFTKLDELLDAAPSRVLYAHPIPGYTYLLTGARNPTRYEFLLTKRYHRPEQIREVIDNLEAGAVPYVVIEPGATAADDPILLYVRDHYDPVPTRPAIAGWIWKRRAGTS